MILKAKDFHIKDLEFKQFSLNVGEYLSIDMPGAIDWDTLDLLLQSLSGKIKSDSIELGGDIIPVYEPIVKSKATFLFRKSAYRFLKEGTGYSKEKIDSILDGLGIDPKINIYRLGANEKMLLALENAYSKSKNIILLTSGLDYNGIKRVKERVWKELNQGSLIEINYESSGKREYLFKENEVKSKRMRVKKMS